MGWGGVGVEMEAGVGEWVGSYLSACPLACDVVCRPCCGGGGDGPYICLVCLSSGLYASVYPPVCLCNSDGGSTLQPAR